ncbi:hypothetical protein CXP54_20190 [Escherichia albertii]|nr:hypothetical protein CXP54_20190 [Escherichia albertii]EAB1454616.1 hypothetical protein [Escherichia albertii]EEW7342038.1 hypothetical protein [Escherichia albertii]
MDVIVIFIVITRASHIVKEPFIIMIKKAINIPSNCLPAVVVTAMLQMLLLFIMLNIQKKRCLLV